MITRQTAYDICLAYDEITKSKTLLEKLEHDIKAQEIPDLRDAFGRTRGLQLGIPSGESSQRLFDVHPNLAVAVIKAHIAEKESVLIALNEVAKSEFS